MQLDLLYKEDFLEIIDGIPLHNQYYLMNTDDFYRGNGRYINTSAEEYEMCLHNMHLNDKTKYLTISDFFQPLIIIDHPYYIEYSFKYIGKRKFFLN